jgi:ketosteroid isomerase-like protein
MSQENVEVVRAVFEVLEREGEEAVLPCFDPAIVWEVRSDLPDADIYRGHHGLQRLFETVKEALDDPWFSPREFIEVADEVVVVLSWGGRGRGSGLAIQEREETWIFTVRDRKIVQVREFADRREALEAARLSD